MKRESIRKAILKAAEDWDENILRYQNQAIKWAKYIEKEIGTPQSGKVKSKAITLTGCMLTLPDDCKRVIKVLKGNYEDQCNNQYNSGNINLNYDAREDVDGYDGLLYVWTPLEAQVFNQAIWEEIGNELHMISIYSNSELTLVYESVDIDEKGNWLVNESHIDAISKYIIYKFDRKSLSRKHRSDKLTRNTDIVINKDLERDYSIAILNARAEDGKKSAYQENKLGNGDS